MKRLMAIFVLAFYSLLNIFPQQVWTGSALGGNSTDFPSGGLVGASNSFPLGTQVDVTNPSSGETVRVTITSRVNEPGVLLLLSQEAADQLQVDRRFPSIIQAEPAPRALAPSSSFANDSPFSTDPDLNPSASLGDPNSFLYDQSPVPEIDLPAQTSAPATFDPQPQESTPTQPIAQTQSPESVTSQTPSPLELSTDTGQVLASEPESPSLPPRGISSALQNFRDSEQSTVSPMAERLAAQNAVAQEPEPAPVVAPEVTTEPEPTPEPAPVVTEAEPEPELQPEVPSTAPGPVVINRPDPEPKPEPKPQPIPPTTVTPEPVAPTPEPLEEIVQTPATTLEPQAPYAVPILGDPVEDLLSEYRKDFSEPPLVRSSLGGQLEGPSISRQAPPRPSAPVLPPNPSPDTEETLGTVAASTPRLTPTIQAQRGQDLPIARFGEPETYDDLITRVSPPSTANNLGVNDLPIATVPDAEVASDFLSRPSAPEGISAGIAVPAPRLETTSPADEGIARTAVPGTSPFDSNFPLPNSPLTEVEGGIEPVRATTQPEFLITLVPAELRPAGTVTESEDPSPLGPPVPGESNLRTNLAAPGNPPTPESLTAPGVPPGINPSVVLETPQDPAVPRVTEPEDPSPLGPPVPGESNPRANLATPGNPPIPESLTAPGVPPGTNPSVVLETPQDPADPRVPESPLTADQPDEEGTDSQIVAPLEPLGPETPLGATPPGDPTGEVTINEPADPPRPETLGQPRVPPAREPQTVLASPSTTEKSPEQPTASDSGDDLMVFLEPAESAPAQPREIPPETIRPVQTQPVTPAPTPQPTPTPEPAPVPSPSTVARTPTLDPATITEVLQRDAYYVQIGAFANPESARLAVNAVNPGYPITLHPISGGTQPLYRLFIGPLTEDEKGTALFWFRAKGYRDAFIRSGASPL